MHDGYESSFPCEFLNPHLRTFLLNLFLNALFNIAEYNVILNFTRFRGLNSG